jgi:hypothetical protein
MVERDQSDHCYIFSVAIRIQIQCQPGARCGLYYILRGCLWLTQHSDHRILKAAFAVHSLGLIYALAMP